MNTQLTIGRARTLVAFVSAAVPVLIAGCGKAAPDRVEVFPVDGVVTFDGRPTPGATIVLHPKLPGASQAPAPRAQVEKDGSFRFSTYDAADGVPAGEYVATIAWYKLVGKGNDLQPGPNVLPAKYSNPKTSKWVIRVADQPIRLPHQQLRR